MKRSQRYKTEFSSILIDFGNNKKDDNMYQTIGKIVNEKIRINDYFGKLSEERFIILTSSTSLSGAMILAEKIETLFRKNDNISDTDIISFGITQSNDIDTYQSIMEKLDDAVNKAKNDETKGRIEIET